MPSGKREGTEVNEVLSLKPETRLQLISIVHKKYLES